MRGRTELTDDELSTTIWRTRVLSWSKVTSPYVERTVFGEIVSVGGAGRPYRLAAPRTGPIARDPQFEDKLAELERRHTAAGGNGWLRRSHPAWLVGCLVLFVAAYAAAFSSSSTNRGARHGGPGSTWSPPPPIRALCSATKCCVMR